MGGTPAARRSCDGIPVLLRGNGKAIGDGGSEGLVVVVEVVVVVVMVVVVMEVVVVV